MSILKGLNVNLKGKRAEKEDSALRFILTLSLLGLVAIFIYTFQELFYVRPEGEGNYVLYYTSTILLMAGATYCSGSLMGFLFGIPRVATDSNGDGSHPNERYVGNDNLLQVSDWLTKIIVGVGLTQMYSIPTNMYHYATILADSSGINNPPFVLFVLIYFGVLGFLFGYLWTRLYFIQSLINTDKGIKEGLTEAVEKINLLQDYISTGIQLAGQIDFDQNTEKGKWGGLASSNGRTVEALITYSDTSTDYYNVNLTVKSTDLKNPLTGDVKFYLPPSFQNQKPIVTSKNGIATLNLLAFCTFTAGIECDNGKTQLEIDLSEVNNVPEQFKNRSL